MGKRSNFKRKKKDFYQTPPEPVLPLLKFLDRKTFAEPCAGAGALANVLIDNGFTCTYACDIEPKHPGILQRDVLTEKFYIPHPIDQIITNPPWSRDLLHPMIDKFSLIAPTWLLFDADWMHTKQALPYLKDNCRKIISVGRVKWFSFSKFVGKDNASWYLFDRTKEYENKFPLFYGNNIQLGELLDLC